MCVLFFCQNISVDHVATEILNLDFPFNESLWLLSNYKIRTFSPKIFFYWVIQGRAAQHSRKTWGAYFSLVIPSLWLTMGRWLSKKIVKSEHSKFNALPALSFPLPLKGFPARRSAGLPEKLFIWACRQIRRSYGCKKSRKKSFAWLFRNQRTEPFGYNPFCFFFSGRTLSGCSRNVCTFHLGSTLDRH